MSYTLGEIAEIVGGELRGDPNRVVEAALPLSEASPQSITFVSSPRQLKKLTAHAAAAYFVTPPLAYEMTESGCNLIVVADPLAAMQIVAKRFQEPLESPADRIDPRAAIDPTAQIGAHVSIGPFAVIGPHARIGSHTIIHPHAVVGQRCVIGEHVEIHPHAVLYPRTVVADRVTIHAGVVLGCDGFGYRFEEGRQHKIEQLGNVEIGSDVEIGACSTIDRATFGTTRVGEGTKIDNLVMVGHNSQIGKHNIFVSQVGISGSCQTGDFVVLAGQVGIADHVSIGTGATLMARSGVPWDVPAGQTYGGAPARPEWQAKREAFALAKLPSLRREVAEIKRMLEMNKAKDSEQSDFDRSRVA